MEGLSPTETMMIKLFESRLDDLKELVVDGFNKITQKQDIANGRTAKAEASIMLLDEKTKGMSCVAHRAEVERLATAVEYHASSIESLVSSHNEMKGAIQVLVDANRKAAGEGKRRTRKRMIIEGSVITGVLGFIQWLIARYL